MALMLAVVGMTIGCADDNRATVKGTVTFDGEPIEEGSIIFEPVDGAGPAAGGRIDDGEYLLTGESGVMPGKKLVRIVASRKTGKQVEETPGGPMVDEVLPFIPPKYNQLSTLEVEVQPGKNTHDFELTSE